MTDSRSLYLTATMPELAEEPRILDLFRSDLRRCGLVGEDRFASLVYLAVTSRLLKRPVSVAAKGPSAVGKSFTIDQVLSFFPPSAYHALSAMSERALVYSEEPLKHRMLVLFEAAGMTGEFQTYLIRSLLSEGRLRYETVDKKTLKPRLIEKEGPTGLIVTTTAINLHPENETRLLSVVANDTADQTRRVLARLAQEGDAGPDLGRWRQLQSWLERQESTVSIPYARDLASLVPPVAVRLRRDFGSVLDLIRAHTLLHRATRHTAPSGAVVATLEDYEVVRGLVADLVADGVEATVAATTRETVEAVADLTPNPEDVCSNADVARALDLDKSAVSRRVRTATSRGFVLNLEERRGKPARLRLGEPLPEELEILPQVGVLRERCSVAVDPAEREVHPENDGLSPLQPHVNTATVGGAGEPGWMVVQRQAGELPETDEKVAFLRLQRWVEGIGGAS